MPEDEKESYEMKVVDGTYPEHQRTYPTELDIWVEVIRRKKRIGILDVAEHDENYFWQYLRLAGWAVLLLINWGSINLMVSAWSMYGVVDPEWGTEELPTPVIIVATVWALFYTGLMVTGLLTIRANAKRLLIEQRDSITMQLVRYQTAKDDYDRWERI